jgi:hypothetical protein
MNEKRRPWCYERLFGDVRRDWDRHDPTCESLHYFWLGHEGGVSCPSDLDTCSDCGVMFYIEGLAWVNHHCLDEDAVLLCGCCARSRGFPIRVTRVGVGV